MYQSAVATAMLCNNHYKIAAGCMEKYSFRVGICRSFCPSCLSSALRDPCLWLGHTDGQRPENKPSHNGACPGCGYGAPTHLPLLHVLISIAAASPAAQPGIQKVWRVLHPMTAGSCEALEPLVEPCHLPGQLLIWSSTMQSRT